MEIVEYILSFILKSLLFKSFQAFELAGNIFIWIPKVFDFLYTTVGANPTISLFIAIVLVAVVFLGAFAIKSKLPKILFNSVINGW